MADLQDLEDDYEEAKIKALSNPSGWGCLALLLVAMVMVTTGARPPGGQHPAGQHADR